MAPPVRRDEARPDRHPADISPERIVADEPGVTAAGLLAINGQKLADDPGIGDGPAAQSRPAQAEIVPDQVARIGEGFLEAGFVSRIGRIEQSLED